MANDFGFIFYWWILLFGVGIISLPLTFFFFKKFFDYGYGLAKIIGILCLSYLVWLFGSLKILPFFSETIWLIILGLACLNYLLLRSSKFGQTSENPLKKIKNVLATHWKIFALEEGFFFVALCFWSYIRGFQPNIEGLEKFMDYGFVNSILRSRYFPPADMWLAGETINYYYFGHLTSAILTKLSGLDSAITYNLMIATIFALSFGAAFCLGGNLIFLGKKSGQEKAALKYSKFILKKYKLIIAGGILSALLLTLGGNLHPLWWFLKNGNFKNYWYPDATRFIVEQFGAKDNTIHEFPIYSFVVADLHGHLLNLPFVLLLLGVALSLFTNQRLPLPKLAFISLLMAVFYMTNSWDFAIYFLVLGGLILYFNYLKTGYKIQTILSAAKAAFGVLVAAVVFSLPFHLHFKNIAQGIALTDFHSPLWMLPVLWGFPLIVTLVFVFFVLQPWVKKVIPRGFSPNYFVLVLILVSWFLIIVPEFIYVKDIYIHSHQRANTMFKLTYQSFVMFCLIASFTITKVLSGMTSSPPVEKRGFQQAVSSVFSCPAEWGPKIKEKLLRFSLLIIFCLSLLFIFIYPRYAIRSYYGLKQYLGLYGLNYLKQLYPDDYEGIIWLKQNVSGQPVIAEAVGESYTGFARVSANTGLPTILGWRVHEWLWRGSFDEAGKRTEEVKNIFLATNPSSILGLLGKYNVRYIFLGTLEKQQYPGINQNVFSRLGTEVFSSGETKIYKLNY